MEDALRMSEFKRELVTFSAALSFHIIHQVVYMCSIYRTDGVGRFNDSSVFEQFPTEMDPGQWGATCWQIVLAIQLAWLSHFGYYFLACNNDETAQKQLSWARVLFCVGSFFNTLRVALFAYAQLTASFAMALFATVTMLPSAYLLTSLPRVVAPKKCDDIIMKFSYYFNNFAISVMAGWTAFYMLILLAMTLAYESPIEATSESASTACLSIFLVGFLLIMLLHLCPLERVYRRHMGIQVIMIVAAGCIFKNLEVGTINGNLSLIILVLTLVGLLVKSVLGVIWDKMERHISIETLPVIQA